ncbi:PSMD1 [Mytilus coruscus]|uniref:PSMD1 n=1 Tax=Mytilus coruscus TaxID=42192 RepID=A0A6J8AU50_MYTCO|nr:PSMD1 [Mytilus coruscus]
MVDMTAVMDRTPEQCPSVVSLLSESYNPHVRFGAAMALGIACAGTGLKEAIGLLEPMTNDPVNYVRQGALIASAMVTVQQNEITCPKVAHFRTMYAKVISDKHEDVMAKFGAIVAQGIIDAGGRNMTISLQSKMGHTNLEAVVGMLVFTQFWFWYPLSHFLCLSFKPTCLIGLNEDLKMPILEFRSNAKPSHYAYPPPLEDKKEKTKEKVETAVLSITAKQKKKEAEKKEKEEKMDVDDEKKDDEKEKEKADDKKEKKEEERKEEKMEESSTEKKEKEPEPTFQILTNPARVMKQQLKVINMPEGSRYKPIKEVSSGGIILLKNCNPDEKEEIIEPSHSNGLKIRLCTGARFR